MEDSVEHLRCVAMSERKRRRAERREETFPVLVTTPSPIEIEGQSVDFMSFGVLLTAEGSPRASHAFLRMSNFKHTFCSHLAMRGAPARAIQELAGYQDLDTTQRYMHLSPAAMEGAIRLLDQPAPSVGSG